MEESLFRDLNKIKRLGGQYSQAAQDYSQDFSLYDALIGTGLKYGLPALGGMAGIPSFITSAIGDYASGPITKSLINPERYTENIKTGDWMDYLYSGTLSDVTEGYETKNLLDMINTAMYSLMGSDPEGRGDIGKGFTKQTGHLKAPNVADIPLLREGEYFNPELYKQSGNYIYEWLPGSGENTFWDSGSGTLGGPVRRL